MLSLDSSSFSSKDVYKRQGHDCAVKGSTIMINMCGNTVVILHASDHTVIAVSYTHLDVYKRQLLDISVDQFFYPDRQNSESDCRQHIDRLLNSMDEKELTVMEATAEGLQKARETEVK